ncbi:MAG: diguanylate cyclase, partial [Acidobacteriota bacterium]|nr:diguanylate cyclase [Acidobacteriota bacterium]
ENLGRDLGELVEGSRRLDDEVIARITANLTQIRRAAIREYGSMHGGRELVEVVSPASEQPQEEDRPLLVYLIDKDMVFANELSIQLELFGYKVEVYAGMEDFERCERDIAPDAVVVAYDQNESALNEKRDHRLKHIPLIFIGPDEEVETRLSALRSGGDAFFTRPLRTENLLTCLDGLTSRRPMSSFRVLVVEDDRFMAEYICDALRQAGMIAKPVTEPMKIMKPLHDFNPDLILMDMYLPQCDGSELARLIRQESAYAGVPIVFLSGEKDPFKQEDIKGMGVDDFLTKPIKPELLVSSISHRVLRFRELRALMARDHLTGLFNYATVKEHFFTEVERAKRVKTPCTLGIIDLDSLGRINARHGHAGGDAAMRNLALILTQRLRGSDHIGCFEGAALLVVLTNTDGVRALQVMDEIRRDFHRINLTLGRTAFHASFSAGLASYPRFRKAKTMIEAAEQALQKAKKLGRNRVELAN